MMDNTQNMRTIDNDVHCEDNDSPVHDQIRTDMDDDSDVETTDYMVTPCDEIQNKSHDEVEMQDDGSENETADHIIETADHIVETARHMVPSCDEIQENRHNEEEMQEETINVDQIRTEIDEESDVEAEGLMVTSCNEIQGNSFNEEEMQEVTIKVEHEIETDHVEDMLNGENRKKYTCDICSDTFDRKKKLKKHMSITHCDSELSDADFSACMAGMHDPSIVKTERSDRDFFTSIKPVDTDGTDTSCNAATNLTNHNYDTSTDDEEDSDRDDADIHENDAYAPGSNDDVPGNNQADTTNDYNHQHHHGGDYAGVDGTIGDDDVEIVEFDIISLPDSKKRKRSCIKEDTSTRIKNGDNENCKGSSKRKKSMRNKAKIQEDCDSDAGDSIDMNGLETQSDDEIKEKQAKKKIKYKKNKRHGDVETERRLYECEFCSKTFEVAESFMKHLDVHIKEIESGKVSGKDKKKKKPAAVKEKKPRKEKKEVKEKKPAVGFSVKESADDPSERRFVCDICAAEFKSKWNCQFHVKTHTGERPFACDLCNARFTRLGGLVTHKKIHAGIKAFKCTVCEAAFNQKGNLDRHMAIHTGQKPYKCQFCEASFVNSTQMKEHNMLHTGEKMFRCDTCNLKFLKEKSYQKHLEVHLGEKPYRCDICYATFVLRYSYTRHMQKNIHNGDTEFKCPYCDLELTTEKRYNNHLRKHTDPEKKYKCDMCFAEFGMKAALARHKKVHSSERPFKCDLCDAVFAQSNHLKIHQRLHTGDTPFKCEICDLAFFTKSAYSIHMKSHDKPISHEPNSFQVPNLRLSDGIDVNLVDRMKVLKDLEDKSLEIINEMVNRDASINEAGYNSHSVNVNDVYNGNTGMSEDDLIADFSKRYFSADNFYRNHEIPSTDINQQDSKSDHQLNYTKDSLKINTHSETVIDSIDTCTSKSDIDVHKILNNSDENCSNEASQYNNHEANVLETNEHSEIDSVSSKKCKSKNKRDGFSIDSLIMKKMVAEWQ